MQNDWIPNDWREYVVTLSDGRCQNVFGKDHKDAMRRCSFIDNRAYRIEESDSSSAHVRVVGARVKKYYRLVSKGEAKQRGKDVSKSGWYTIPVEWTVCSTIAVKADSLQDAVKLAQAKVDDIPLCDQSEYIEGTYKLNLDTVEEEFDENAPYGSILNHFGNVMVTKDKIEKGWG